MKATYRRKSLKRRIMYSYGHPGSMNPAVTGNKEAEVIYGKTTKLGLHNLLAFARKQGRM